MSPGPNDGWQKWPADVNLSNLRRLLQESETARLPLTFRDLLLREVELEHDRISQEFLTASIPLAIDRDHLSREVKSEHDRISRKFETARIPLATIFFLLLILFTSTVKTSWGQQISWYTEVREPK